MVSTLTCHIGFTFYYVLPFMYLESSFIRIVEGQIWSIARASWPTSLVKLKEKLNEIHPLRFCLVKESKLSKQIFLSKILMKMTEKPTKKNLGSYS